MQSSNLHSWFLSQSTGFLQLTHVELISDLFLSVVEHYPSYGNAPMCLVTVVDI